MNITVLCVGKIKEKYFRDAIDEYSKRLDRYCKFQVVEVKDEPTPDSPSDAEKELVLKREGKRILEKLPDFALVIPLCIEGKTMTSEKLADFIDKAATAGTSHIVFIIGGSFGLSDEVKSRANLSLSFSPMTFPHQLMRVILLEQIYRAFNINNGGKYHK
ncbi:MAG: 23S rRNA (pseudouridine(1915)-N(3))-methyltransferase RlmH [Clostridia bacterium]|nr:23S rRNA (pseudouridine(1915)-N(3))-methyltransferase RlmH [Clostridia bacterium]